MSSNSRQYVTVNEYKPILAWKYAIIIKKNMFGLTNGLFRLISYDQIISEGFG